MPVTCTHCLVSLVSLVAKESLTANRSEGVDSSVSTSSQKRRRLRELKVRHADPCSLFLLSWGVEKTVLNQYQINCIYLIGVEYSGVVLKK